MPPSNEKASSATAYREVRAAAEGCRDCDLWKPATQTVFGEGPVPAELMLMGETPGDHEDREGHPFVGPAGHLLDDALVRAGIDRSALYLTNAVKHFKFVPGRSSKVRLHKTPNRAEVAACRQWSEREIEIVEPAVLGLLGATAAQAVLGPSFRVSKQRGEPFDVAVGDTGAGTVVAIATVHPSAVLRGGDRRAEMLDSFVHDLETIAAHIDKTRDGPMRGAERAPDRDVGLAVQGLARALLSAQAPDDALARVLLRTLRTVEVNNTFYRLPKASTFADWSAAGAGRISSSRSRRATTSRTTSACSIPRSPSTGCSSMPSRSGPASRSCCCNSLRTSSAHPIDSTRRCRRSADASRVAVEPRHPSWFCAEVRSVLEAHSAALCLADRGSRADHAAVADGRLDLCAVPPRPVAADGRATAPGR